MIKLLSFVFFFSISFPLFSQVDTIHFYSDLNDALKEPEKVVKLRLRRERLKQIPDTVFTAFPNLKFLDLSKNSLTELPDKIEKLEKLETLNLSKNRLTTLPESIGNLRSLKLLNVNQNKITHLPPAIGKLENLEYLDLWGNELTDLPKEMADLNNLKEIDLRVILFNDNEQKRLKKLFSKTTVVHFSPGCNCGK